MKRLSLFGHLLCGAVCTVLNTFASAQVLPFGADACEADWLRRSQFDKVGSVVELRYWETFAERGVLGMQLRLGLLRSSADGQWTAPKDRSYNVKWLEKAQAQGSKSATWELARLSNSATPEEYLRSAIEAAEAERNPWAATRLMRLTDGRLGADHEPTSCLEKYEPGGKCAPPELLPISSARKWAEIAAEGGNADAQAWLCRSAIEGNLKRGQPQDDKAALKWCGIAINNACDSRSLSSYLAAVRAVEGQEAFEAESARLSILEKQPWRRRSNAFFEIYYQRWSN